MINSLLYDIWITSAPMTLWTEFFNRRQESSDIKFAFLMTRGGLIRFHDNSQDFGKPRSIEKDLSQYGELYEKDQYPAIYRRTSSYDPGTYVYYQTNNPKYSKRKMISILKLRISVK